MNETKKVIAVLLLLAICLSLLPSCGKSDLSIDGMEFEFLHARKGDKMLVLACASSLADKYKSAKTVDYTLTANKKVLTVTGEGGTYTGEYKIEKLLKESVVYTISIGEEEGHASLSEKVLENGTVEYTLILTIRGYFVTFTAKYYTTKY
jgi:hypothetical protein